MFATYQLNDITSILNIIATTATVLCLIVFFIGSSRTSSRLTRIGYRFDTPQDLKDEYDYETLWLSVPLSMNTISLFIDIALTAYQRFLPDLVTPYSVSSAIIGGLMGVSIGLILMSFVYMPWAHRHIVKGSRQYRI